MASPRKKRLRKAAKKKAARRLRQEAHDASCRNRRKGCARRNLPAAKKRGAQEPARARGNVRKKRWRQSRHDLITCSGTNNKGRKLDPFTRGQKEKLLQLRDAMVDSMAGVAKDNLALPRRRQ